MPLKSSKIDPPQKPKMAKNGPEGGSKGRTSPEGGERRGKAGKGANVLPEAQKGMGREVGPPGGRKVWEKRRRRFGYAEGV